MNKSIAVGLSGGVDSSFAAYLLKEQGWNVVGITLKFFPCNDNRYDPESLHQAQSLCQWLGVPHHVFDVQSLFKEKVIDYFVASYLKGKTPNPCVMCNKFIKFGYLIRKARELGIEFFATGHYIRLIRQSQKLFLGRAKDLRKSQEYFLALIRPEILSHLVFPVGEYTKEQVRSLAKERGIIFRARPESQDVCFVPAKSYAGFIKTHSGCGASPEGKIMHCQGKVLGVHPGIHHFTIGQRPGLGVSWNQPLYVLELDAASNAVIVGERKWLERDSFQVQNLNWFDDVGKYNEVSVKIRYNTNPYPCTIEKDDSIVRVQLKQKAAAIAPGQVAAFYSDDLLIGAGVILR